MTLAERFARLSGAKLAPKTQTAVLEPEHHESDTQPNDLSVALPAVVSAADDTPAAEERTFIADKFNTKQPLWQKPQVKIAVIAVPALAATFGILAAMNGSFTMPSAPKVVTTPPPDDTTPKQASVGDVQGVALSRSLSTGFDKEAERKNPFLENGLAATPTSATQRLPNGKLVTTGRPANPADSANPGMAARTYPVTRIARPTSAPPMDDVPAGTYRAYNPPARRDSASSSTASQTYPTTPTYGPSVAGRAGAATIAAAPRPVTQTTASPQPPAKSAQDRRLAVIAATSSGTDTAQQSAANPGTAGSPAMAQTQSPHSGAGPSAGAGYQEAVYLPAETAVLDGVPQQLINRSKKAQGRLVTGLAFTPGASQFMQGQPVEVAIENPLDSGLPQGAHLIATIDLQQQGGAQMSTAPVRLIPTAITIGDAEYPLPQGAILLTGQNGAPLVAKRQGSGFLRFVGGLAKSAVGGIGGVVTSLLGTSPILTALSPQQTGLLGTQGTAQQTGNEVLALRENSPIQINIIQPFSLPQTQALFPLPQPAQRLSYLNPSDVELNQIIQDQTGQDLQQQVLSQDSQAQLIEQQPAQPQADSQSQPTENTSAQH